MKNKIIEILNHIWAFIQALAALAFMAFIVSLILFLAISAVYGAVWSFDKLLLGGVLFG